MIRRVNSSGTISTYPTSRRFVLFANLENPEGLTFDLSGNLAIADPNSDAIYEGESHDKYDFCRDGGIGVHD